MRLHERSLQLHRAAICTAVLGALILGPVQACPGMALQVLAAETGTGSADAQQTASGALTLQTAAAGTSADAAVQMAETQAAAGAAQMGSVQTTAGAAQTGTASAAAAGTEGTQTATDASGALTLQTAAAGTSADAAVQTAEGQAADAVDMQVILNDPELFEQYVAQLTLQVEELQRQQEEEASQKKAAREELSNQTRSKTWKGAVLNRKKGTVKGPNGRETYYNLNMSKIVAVLHKAGYEGDYWVRKDGVKMFGDYIMVAANYSRFRYGTIVETSLGTGIVCDTGDFAKSSRVVLDIAASW